MTTRRRPQRAQDRKYRGQWCQHDDEVNEQDMADAPETSTRVRLSRLFAGAGTGSSCDGSAHRVSDGVGDAQCQAPPMRLRPRVSSVPRQSRRHCSGDRECQQHRRDCHGQAQGVAQQVATKGRTAPMMMRRRRDGACLGWSDRSDRCRVRHRRVRRTSWSVSSSATVRAVVVDNPWPRTAPQLVEFGCRILAQLTAFLARQRG